MSLECIGRHWPVDFVVLVPRPTVRGVDGALEVLLRVDVEVVDGVLLRVHRVDVFHRDHFRPFDRVPGCPLHLRDQTAVADGCRMRCRCVPLGDKRREANLRALRPRIKKRFREIFGAAAEVLTLGLCTSLCRSPSHKQ